MHLCLPLSSTEVKEGFKSCQNYEVLSYCLLLSINDKIKPFMIHYQIAAKNKYLLIFIMLAFVHLLLDETSVTVSFRIPPGRLYRASSQLPHQPHTAHFPWSSLQLATYSMWHLLPSSNEFFMSLPLPLTRRRGSYQPRSVNLCYCKLQCCHKNLWPPLSCHYYRLLLIGSVLRQWDAQCRWVHNFCVCRDINSCLRGSSKCHVKYNK